MQQYYPPNRRRLAPPARQGVMEIPNSAVPLGGQGGVMEIPAMGPDVQPAPPMQMAPLEAPAPAQDAGLSGLSQLGAERAMGLLLKKKLGPQTNPVYGGMKAFK